MKDWLDHPVIFLFAVSMGVIAFMGLFGVLFTMLGWPGPLSLVKGGVK